VNTFMTRLTRLQYRKPSVSIHLPVNQSDGHILYNGTVCDVLRSLGPQATFSAPYSPLSLPFPSHRPFVLSLLSFSFLPPPLYTERIWVAVENS